MKNPLKSIRIPKIRNSGFIGKSSGVLLNIAQLFRYVKIKVRLMAVFILLSSIPLIILGIFSYSKSSTAIETQNESFSSEIALQSAQNIRNSMYIVESALSNFQNNKDWMEALNKFDQGTYSVDDLSIEIYNSMSSQFSASAISSCIGYALIHNDQFVISNLNTHTSDFTENIKNFSDYAKKGNGKPVWLPMKGITTNVPYIASLMTIYNEASGNPLATLAVILDANYFYNILSNISIAGSSDILLLNTDGIVISAKDNKKWPVNSKYPNKAIVDGIASEIKKINNTRSNNNNDNQLIKGTFEAKIDGSSHMVCFSQLPGTNLNIMGTIPMSFLKTASNEIMYTMITVSIAIFILAVLISIFISASISRPLNRLGGLMKEASDGNLSVSAKDKYKDEISILSSSFDNMVKNIRSLVSKVSESSINVLKRAEEVSNLSAVFSASTEQVAESMSQIAKGTAEQAEDNSKTLEFVNILSKDINNVGSEVSAASHIIHNTKSLSENAINAVKSLNENTVKTSKVTDDIVKNINALNSDMKEIQKIIKFIGSISEQTNLLSLNAAIEAARAGEAGKGFAVVAGQVRKLADQTKESLSSISSIIKNIEEKSKLTVLSATNTQEIISQQVDAVNETDNSFKAILEALENISSFTNRFETSVSKILESGQLTLEAINNISSVSQETAATVQEVTATSQQQMDGVQEVANNAKQLNQLAEELHNSISIFKV